MKQHLSTAQVAALREVEKRLPLIEYKASYSTTRALERLGFITFAPSLADLQQYDEDRKRIDELLEQANAPVDWRVKARLLSEALELDERAPSETWQLTEKGRRALQGSEKTK